MSRFVLLKQADVELVVPGGTAPAAPAAPAPPLPDPAVEFGGYTPEGEFSFIVPPIDPTKVNALVAVHVGLYPKNADGTPNAGIPTDPAQVVKAPEHFSARVDPSTLPTGGTVKVDATEGSAGKSTALLVLELAQ